LCATGKPHRGPARVTVACRFERPTRHQSDDRIDPPVAALDLFEMRLHDFQHRHLSAAHQAHELSRGQKA
jgi:hypothetical protein